MDLNYQTKNWVFGQSVAEFIQTVSGELTIDAVGLWQIVPACRQQFESNDQDFLSLYVCVFWPWSRAVQSLSLVAIIEYAS